MSERLPVRDPRTVARDIPGIFDALFPQLVPGIVAHFNRSCFMVESCQPVPAEIIEASSLQRSMLFEIAVAAAEQLIMIGGVRWDSCLELAVKRQRRHFDVNIPTELRAEDRSAAQLVAENLVAILRSQQQVVCGDIVCSPAIPGYQWISSGVGDFSIGRRLIEVKCTNRRFSSSDYRQVVMYWLLSYAYSLEHKTSEWTDFVLVNPRLNIVVSISFDEIVHVISAGRSKVEILALFSTMIAVRDSH